MTDWERSAVCRLSARHWKRKIALLDLVSGIVGKLDVVEGRGKASVAGPRMFLWGWPCLDYSTASRQDFRFCVVASWRVCMEYGTAGAMEE